MEFVFCSRAKSGEKPLVSCARIYFLGLELWRLLSITSLPRRSSVFRVLAAVLVPMALSFSGATAFAASLSSAGGPGVGKTDEVPAQVRVFPAGRDSASGRYRAVVEITLADGYKTYWREPGDSGVPTAFDWSASRNVADTHVLYPTPVRFYDGVGYAIGYLSTVRFPLEVVPIAADQPVEMNLDIAFGVCREICIPEQATASAILSDVVQIAGLWEETMAQVPAAVPPGSVYAGLGVTEARLEEGNLHLTVTGELGESGDVFVEGPARWQFGRPLIVPRKEGADVTIPVRHPLFDEPVAVTVTLAGATGAIETRLDLDPPK